ncbi:ABC transporter ATP-binding protein [Iamia majanohamensis]|uniref:ABC transporter ATP-binding protein n=1 Tax=Iamia majanohamensis TaxID=467976 RepID=A0AAE9Y383_9ACTN|nr:ABC transporter ATP-binding protein [Iamia majanohamensis]WCO65570.1 ABC transporter ATP-binding protein [Iamia majanohamensis]
MATAPASAPRDGARLLLGELRPERRAIAVLAVILVVAVGLPVGAQLLLGRFVDEAAAGATVGRLTTVAVTFGALLLVADVLQLAVTALAVRLAWRIGNRLRVDLCRHALDLDLAWHGEHSAGEVIERVDGDIEAVTRFASTAVLQVVGNVAVLVAVGAVALVVEWRAGVVLLATVGVALAVLVRMRSLAVPSHDHEREVLSHLYGDLEERLGGLEDIRANGAGPWAVDRLHRHSARWWRAARRASLRGEGGYATTGITFAVGTAATLGVAAVLAARGQITLGTVLVLFRFVQMVQSPLERIGEQLSEFQKAVAGVRRAARLLGTPVGVVPGERDLPSGPLAVDLDHVALRYDADADHPPALRDVDLRLAPGTSLGVVGRTGSGKTSLGRLLARFWDPTSGAVRVGGVDLRTVAVGSLRRRVAVVTQEVEVLRASLRDNLTLLGTLPASDERLHAVLADVGLDGWLADLPDGLDTALDGTARLSGGEAQLLAFARVLLGDPGLVVLDEATSRLDPDTEVRVQAATRRLREGRTLVVIAHRLSTLDGLDEVAVVDDGRIVEHGPRAALASDPTTRFAALLAAGAGHGVPR